MALEQGCAIYLARMTLAEPLSPSEALALCDSALSLAERHRLRELEDIISRGLETFLEVGKALEEIREARLYRNIYPTFEAYVRDRWAISLSRANQMVLSMQTARNLVDAGALSQEQAAAYPETLFRPLSRVTPELQTLTFELVKRIEAEPDAALVNKVVSRVRDAIAKGWQDREGRGRSIRNNNARNSGQLSSFVRLASRLDACDPTAIAAGDDQATLQRHLRAARQLMTFCSKFVIALEGRLVQQQSPPSQCIAALLAN